jgi:hypothetical protein
MHRYAFRSILAFGCAAFRTLLLKPLAGPVASLEHRML